MKHHISKRRQPWARTAVYSLMTTVVIVLVTLLMLVVLGYSFNQRDGRLEQGGLLQLSSSPSGATVTLNERVLGSRTSTKATVDSGSYSVWFDRQGYRPWKKTITITPGQIGWLNYARLIPTETKPSELREFPTLASTLASPGGNWLLALEAADQPVFQLADLRGDTVRYTTLTLPEATYTTPTAGKGQSFAIESWSQNENAVLIRHSYNDDQVEWLLLNRENTERSINVSVLFGVKPSKLVFAGGGDRLLFAQTDDTVRRINLDEQTVSRPLASRVAEFSPYDDKLIIYTTTPDDKSVRTVGYATPDIAQPVPIRTYPTDDQSLHAVMRTYFNKRYLSVAHGTQLTIDAVEKLPTLTDKSELTRYADVTIPTGSVRLESTGRFVTAQLPDGFATYDLELKKYDKTAWAYVPNADRPIKWLDGYIIWSDAGGQLRLYEFDGANQQTIFEVAEGYTATLSPNGKYLYGITKSDTGLALSRTQLLP